MKCLKDVIVLYYKDTSNAMMSIRIAHKTVANSHYMPATRVIGEIKVDLGIKDC